MKTRLAVSLVLVFLISVVPAASGGTLTCSSSTTLEELTTCIRSQMPGTGSNGFVIPTSVEQTGWRLVVNQMLSGSCNFTLPTSLTGIMMVKNFHDATNNRDYCVFMEILDANNNGIVDRGWGTFIVFGGASREISLFAPHPIADSTTESQAVGVFKGTDSRSVFVSGSHRNASTSNSSCQSEYRTSDAAHNMNVMTQATTAQLIAFYGEQSWTEIQFHGKAADSCSRTDVYLTHGHAMTPVAGDPIVKLRENLLADHPNWRVDLPGWGACALNGADCTQGRLVNGVDPTTVCSNIANSYNGRFIHIEQSPGFRSTGDWIDPIVKTWPVGQVPAAPANLVAIGGIAQVHLGWSPSSGAESYTLKRSLSNGGPYTIVAKGVEVTNYMDVNLAAGAMYFYVVCAVNAAGESPTSAQSAAITAPPAPVGLTANTGPAGTDAITLSWLAAHGASSYRVKCAVTSGGAYIGIYPDVVRTDYLSRRLKPGKTYFYIVTAVNIAGESPASNEASATVRTFGAATDPIESRSRGRTARRIQRTDIFTRVTE